jgi:hypothetical protein
MRKTQQLPKLLLSRQQLLFPPLALIPRPPLRKRPLPPKPMLVVRTQPDLPLKQQRLHLLCPRRALHRAMPLNEAALAQL